MYNLLETTGGDINTQPTNTTVDILSDAVAEIVNDTPIVIEYPTEVKTTQKGRKRGRKLGYRSANSNGDDAVCGVCGAKVGTTPYCPDTTWAFSITLH